jgi:hypothetical protein
MLGNVVVDIRPVFPQIGGLTYEQKGHDADLMMMMMIMINIWAVRVAQW